VVKIIVLIIYQDAPKVPPSPLSLYGWKSVSDDIAELARQLNAPKIILGGHDWGGAVVYRCALWHPELVTHLFSICTPFQTPTKEFVPMDEVLKKFPQLGYQVHLAGPEVEAAVRTKDDIKHFLNGMYGGRTPNGEVLFNPKSGIVLKNLPNIGKTPLLSDKVTFSRSGRWIPRRPFVDVAIIGNGLLRPRIFA